jgi:NAD(P)H-hydrate epimerase
VKNTELRLMALRQIKKLLDDTTGDVLTGVIAGLVAQGMPLFDAAACGVYLHGQAGEMVRREMGDAGMLAGDLLPALPTVIRGLKQVETS